MINSIIYAADSRELKKRSIEADANTLLIVRRKTKNSHASNIKSLAEILDSDHDLYRRLFTEFLLSLADGLPSRNRSLKFLQVDESMSGWWLSKLQLRSVQDNTEYFLPVLEYLVLQHLCHQHTSVELLIFGCPILAIRHKLTCRSNTDNNLGVRILKSLFLFYQYTVVSCYILLNALNATQFYAGLFYRSVLRTPNNHSHDTHCAEKEILFVAPLAHLDTSEASKDNFRSNYWAQLPDELRRASILCDFLHLYRPRQGFADSSSAANKIKTFNNPHSSHYLIEEYVAPSLILASAIEYTFYTARLLLISCSCICSLLRPQSEALCLFSLEQFSTLNGAAIFQYLIYKRLFTSFFKFHHYKKVVFVSEYQYWEHCLIGSARDMHTYANFHALIRRWDMRYYPHSHLLVDSSRHYFNLPSGYIVHAQEAAKTLISHGYPPQKLQYLDALRYEDITNLLRKTTADTYHPESSDLSHVMIATDHIRSSTIEMLEIVSSVRPLFGRRKIFLRQHPAYYDESLPSRYSLYDSNILEMSAFDQIRTSSLFIVASETSLGLYSILFDRLPSIYFRNQNLLQTSLLSDACIPSFSDSTSLISFIQSPTYIQKNPRYLNSLLSSYRYKLWRDFISCV